MSVSTLVMMAHMALDCLAGRPLPREPEPDLVMAEPDQVMAFAESGQANGPLAPIYLLLATMAGAALPVQGVVLDLACGPGNQLIQMARLYPQLSFVGVDLSPRMLAVAREQVAHAGVRNVRLQEADISRLEGWPEASVDAVVSTLSLHHLSDLAALQRTMQRVAQVLKPDGSVFLVDFGRLAREATIRCLVHDREAEQSPQFTADFSHSLHAAFSRAELGEAAMALGGGVAWHQTALAPFMVVAQRPAVRPALAAEGEATQVARTAFQALSNSHQRDLLALSNWFAAGGLRCPVDFRA